MRLSHYAVGPTHSAMGPHPPGDAPYGAKGEATVAM